MPFHLFRRPTVSAIVREQLADAEVAAAEHQAAAEHHAALASMFQARVARLRVAGAAVDSSPAEDAWKLHRFVPTLPKEDQWPEVK